MCVPQVFLLLKKRCLKKWCTCVLVNDCQYTAVKNKYPTQVYNGFRLIIQHYWRCVVVIGSVTQGDWHNHHYCTAMSERVTEWVSEPTNERVTEWPSEWVARFCSRRRSARTCAHCCGLKSSVDGWGPSPLRVPDSITTSVDTLLFLQGGKCVGVDGSAGGEERSRLSFPLTSL